MDDATNPFLAPLRDKIELGDPPHQLRLGHIVAKASHPYALSWPNRHIPDPSSIAH
jgi:hypothetical protein